MTLLHPKVEPAEVDEHGAEALIREARRLRRRRWAIGCLVVLVAAASAGLAYGLSRTGDALRTVTRPAVRSGVGAPDEGGVTPKSPGALAIGPDGNLYIADQGRNEILERLPSGRFEVVAGNGRAGFSGDGGPARDAELDGPGGMAITANGTIYVADGRNNRIRMIAPDGIISTVAGDGSGLGPHDTGVSNWTLALRAPLWEPSAVAVGPNGELYITSYGDDQVLRLAPNGRLYIVIGPTHQSVAGVTGVGGPATAATPGGPNGLAFDAHDDLYISANNVKALLMVDPEGRMHLVISSQTGFYPRGDGGLVTGPHGVVYAMDDQQLVRLSPRGERTVANFAIDRPLNTEEGGAFLPGGIAVTPSGVIYTDTSSGNGYANASAILAVLSTRHVHLLWRAGGGG